MKVRLFLALEIPENIKRIITTESKFPGFFRLTKIENIHVTLFFFGEADENKIPEIINNLNEILNPFNSFELEINSFGQFPEHGLPKIIFLTGHKGKDELMILYDKIHTNLSKIGYRDNKEFKYHITVARLNEKANNYSEFRIPEFNNRLSFKAETIILYKSDLNRDGPVYTSMHEWILKKMKLES